MKIRFIKAHTLNGKKRVIGSVTNVLPYIARQLLAKKVVELYDGDPRDKIDSNLFRPK